MPFISVRTRTLILAITPYTLRTIPVEMEIYSKDNIEPSDICSRIKKGSENALQYFYYKYQPKIFHYLYRFVGDRMIAEDLTQETFIKFWTVREKLDADRSCSAYLFSIARNLAINSIQRTVRHISLSSEMTEVIPGPGSYQTGTEVYLNDDYQKAIGSLPQRCRETFLLSRFSELSYSEIAVIMEVSPQTVKNQMNKALMMLRKKLDKYK